MDEWLVVGDSFCAVPALAIRAIRYNTFETKKKEQTHMQPATSFWLDHFRPKAAEAKGTMSIYNPQWVYTWFPTYPLMNVSVITTIHMNQTRNTAPLLSLRDADCFFSSSFRTTVSHEYDHSSSFSTDSPLSEYP